MALGYYGSMKRHAPVVLSLLVAWAATPGLHAQTATPPAQAASAPRASALDGDLFYQLLLGELNVRANEPGTGFSLILDAARKTNDPALYQRAISPVPYWRWWRRQADRDLDASIAEVRRTIAGFIAEGQPVDARLRSRPQDAG